MTHYGLLCPAASGHLHPMTTLGHALRQRGHRLSLIGIADAQERVRSAGAVALAGAHQPQGS